MSIVITPIPSTIELAAPAFQLGTTNTAGAAVTAVASNSTLLSFDTTVPSSPGTVAVGSATVASRRDHVHGGYETGTWIPVLQDGGFSDKGQSSSINVGTYTKIGRVVYVSCRLRMDSLGTLIAGNGANLTGLPYTAVNTSDLAFTLAVRGVTLNISAGQSLTCRVLYNTNYATLELWDLATGAGSALISEITASATLVLTGHYEV